MSNAVSFTEARFGQCRFPLWGDRERIGLVCGDPVRDDKCAYCEPHAARCLVTSRIPPDRIPAARYLGRRG